MAGEKLRCSFCGKGEDEVTKLVAGPNVFICDNCVKLADDIIKTDAGGGDKPAGNVERPSWQKFVDMIRRFKRGFFRAEDEDRHPGRQQAMAGYQ